MNHKVNPPSSPLFRGIRRAPHKPNRSRKEALRRSNKTLTAAIGRFRAFPWGRARAAVELAMEAVQRADLLPANPREQREGQLRAWEQTWATAEMALQQIAALGRRR
jgi:hypothetical protein